MGLRTSLSFKGGLPAAIAVRESQSAVARIPPRLSEGCPHSAASQVSLKSSHRIMAPMLKAAWTGSSWKRVPGTFAPLGTMVPGTIGPSSFVHCGYSRASRPQPRVSIKQYRAVSKASLLETSYLLTYSAMSEITWSGFGRVFDELAVITFCPSWDDASQLRSTMGTKVKFSGPI